jgi:hypothetical protein
VRDAATRLEKLNRRDDPYVPADYRNPHELAQTVLAYRDFRLGRCEAALRKLDDEKGSYWLGVVASSPLASQSFERYIRAECLMTLRRYAEAARWFGTFEQGSMYDLAFLSVALRGQAAVYRAMGDGEAASTIERRLGELNAR